MAHKKGQGSVKNGRDSESKRLGLKRADGQIVPAGRSEAQYPLYDECSLPNETLYAYGSRWCKLEIRYGYL